MYYKKISYDDKDFQSNNLQDPMDRNDSKLMELPKLIKLAASGEILSRRNRKIVLFDPFTDEKQLVINGSYFSKLNEGN